MDKRIKTRRHSKGINTAKNYKGEEEKWSKAHVKPDFQDLQALSSNINNKKELMPVRKFGYCQHLQYLLIYMYFYILS